MKICIIDDELEVRISIIQKLTALFPYEDIFDIGFGQLALDQVNLVRPDLIFLDIRMPEITGLEILNELKIKYPKMHVIIISGYDDFEYARKALQYGAMDYILKPADRGQLKEIVGKVRNHLNQEFYEQLELQVTRIPNAEFTMKDIDIQFYNSSLWFDERRWKKIIFGNSLELIRKYESSPNNVMCTFTVLSNLEGIIVGINQEESNGSFRERDTFIGQFLKQYIKKQQQQFHIRNDNDIGDTSEYVKKEIVKNIAGIRQSILNDARARNMSELESNLEQWFMYLEQLDYMELKNECSILLALLDEGLYSDDIIVVNDEYMQYWHSWVNTFDTWQQLKQKIKTMVLSGVKELKKLEQAEEKPVSHHWFEQALHLIESSGDMNLSLDVVADKVNVHPVTLSRIFKQQMGMNFIRYLTLKRLERSKYLLLHTNKKVNEVAEEVGYADYPYFRSVFKKEFKYSPSEFRQYNQGIISKD